MVEIDYGADASALRRKIERLERGLATERERAELYAAQNRRLQAALGAADTLESVEAAVDRLRDENKALREFARAVRSQFSEHHGCFCDVCCALYQLTSPREAGVRLKERDDGTG